MLTAVMCAGLSKVTHREVEQAGGTYALREQSEGYGCEFAQEDEALTPKKTIPWQKFAETVDR